jgi:hypothetical protein
MNLPKVAIISTLSIFLLSANIVLLSIGVNAQPVDNNSTGSANVSESSSISPQNLTLVPENEPPELTPEQQAQAARSLEEDEIPETPPPVTNENISGPPPGTESLGATSQNNDTGIRNTSGTVRESSIIPISTASILPVAAGDAHVYTNRDVGTHGAVVAEPSVANKGPLVFYTGNWFAARSTDGGTTWTYNNPYGDMADFCCDQDVIYDPHNQIFIWYRQANEDTNNENYFRLGISRDTVNWWYYDIRPTLFSTAWANQWWDYPQLALTDNYLFITSNMFDGTSRAVIAKVSLSSLASGSSIVFNYFEHPFEGRGRRTVTPIQGATDTMYLGTHLSNDQMRIYKWPEASGTYFWYDRNIDSWTASARGSMHCASPDGFNWCAFADNRVLGGWIQNGVVGFLWNVGEGNGFKYPYVNMATFGGADLSYQRRPLVWNDNYAWMYGHVSPNSRGLGLAAYWGGGGNYPILNAAIADSYVPAPAPWQMNWIASGTNAPALQRWGDYIRVRPLNGDSSCPLWIGSGYILNGGSGSTTAMVENSMFPYYYIFGREADAGSSCLPTKVALPITVKITARVIEVAGPDIFGGLIHTGDLITGSYTYDPSIADISPNDPQTGTYLYTSPPFDIILTVNGLTFQTDPQNVQGSITVVNAQSANYVDEFLVVSLNNLPVNGTDIPQITLYFIDSTGEAISSDALPAGGAPDLNNWRQETSLGINGRDGAFIGARVTSASVE